MDKERFDALHKLAEQAWRDWDHKARYQWRLAFGIWGAVLAAMSVIVTRNITVNMLTTVAVCLPLFAIHYIFSAWIEGRIRDCRRQMSQYVQEMEDMVGLRSDEIAKILGIIEKERAEDERDAVIGKTWTEKHLPFNKKWRWWNYRLFVFWHKPAAGVHLAITLFLCFVLLVVIRFINHQPVVRPPM